MWKKIRNWKNIFLIFLSIIHVAVPQAVPISKCDQILSDTNTALRTEEVKLSNLQSSSLPDVQSLAGATTNTASSLSAAAINYGKSLADFGTILNFGVYQNVSACTDINMKISSINFDLQKFVALNTQALQNFTTLQTKINYIVYYYSLSYNNLTAAQVSTYVAIVNEYYAIASGYSEYIYFLSVAYSNETYVQANLQAYKRLYCTCASTVAANVSTLASNLAYIQSPLLADQSKLKVSIGITASAINSAVSGIPVTKTTSNLLNYLQSLSTFLTKAATVNDYATSTTQASTSCADVQNQVTMVKVMYLSCSTVYSQILANASVLDVYIGPVNATLIAYNSTFTASQRNLLQTACNTLGYLRSLYTDYYVDILYASARFGQVLADVSGIGSTYCGCTSNNGTGSTTLATAVIQTTSSITTTTLSTTSTKPTTTTIPTTTSISTTFTSTTSTTKLTTTPSTTTTTPTSN